MEAQQLSYIADVAQIVGSVPVVVGAVWVIIKLVARVRVSIEPPSPDWTF